jgi:hypothetical protein
MKGAKPFLIWNTLLWGLILVFGINACTIGEGLDTTDIELTNTISDTVEATNEEALLETIHLSNQYYITNTITLTNEDDGMIIEGNIYIANVFNEGMVQPTFLLTGYFDGDLPEFVDSMTATVTNNDTNFEALLYDATEELHWKVVIYTQGLSYITVRLSTALSGFGESHLSLNFNVTNIPAYSYSDDYNNLLTNEESIDISGEAYVTEPDTISAVSIIVINEANDTNTVDAELTEKSGWTNTINAKDWNANINLTYGENTIYGYAVSSANISNRLNTLKVVRSLIGVDGVKEATWDSAPVAGVNTKTAYNGAKLNELRITNDAHNIFFWVDASVAEPSSPSDGPRIAITIDTNSASGVTNDAWGGRFTFDMPTNPDFQIQFRIQDGGGQAFYQAKVTNSVYFWTNVANNWSDLGLQGIRMAADYQSGFEVGVPLSLMGLSSGDTINAIVTLSGEEHTEGNQQAWLVIPEDAGNEYSTNANHLDTVKRVYCSPYILK